MTERILDMATVATKQEHLTITVEITMEQKQLFERAAELQGRTLEEFMLDALEAQAEEAIYGRFNVAIRVSPEAYQRFLETLDDPGEPNERLRAALERHRAMFGE